MCRDSDKRNHQNVTCSKPGSLLGEAALLTDEPRNATVRTLLPRELLALGRADLLETIGEDQPTTVRAARERP
jgi:CRP-like cAMP-binding protein